ncbi:MAG: hypothetical protein HY681_10160 [Chloroflexi bacterium]|nr:hypothetical protein [Chloroflexota bacterium]
MDLLIALLRIAHILSGVVMVGNTIFVALVLGPRLRLVAPPVRGQVMGALGPVMTPLQGIMAMVVIASGLALVLALRSSVLGQLWTTGWGWAITAGFVATVAGTIAGSFFMSKTMAQLQAAGAAIQGRPPTGEEAGRMQALQKRAGLLTNVILAMSVIAVVTMAVARYV